VRLIRPVQHSLAVASTSQLVVLSALQGLQMLNAAGYGREGSGLELDLVYNPNGAFLAPAQAPLEEAYRSVRLLSRNHTEHHLEPFSHLMRRVWMLNEFW